MSFLFTCPHCQTKTEVTAEFSGHAGKCVACQGDIQVPHFLPPDSNGDSDAKGRSTPTWLRVGAATTVCVLLTACFFYALASYGGRTLTQISNSRAQSQSMNKLTRIAKAMNSYAADYGTYPPRVTKDATGTPLHSWRVLLLPYLDEQEMYDSLRLDLPWDHELNQQNQYQYLPPSVYVHSRTARNFSWTADYYVIYGPGTLFPSTGPLGPNDLVDDPTQTLLVVEGVPSTAPTSWMQPVDLDISLMGRQIFATNSAANQGLGGFIEDSAAVATVDGRGHVIDDTMPVQTVMALISPKGDERLPDDTLD